MPLIKKCRHGRGAASPAARRRAWRACGCAWLGDLYVAGRRRYVSLGPDEATARARLAQLVADREAGRLVVAGAREASFKAVAARWLTRAGGSGLKPSTLDTYRGATVRLGEWFGEVPVSRIREADVAEWATAADRAYSRQYASNLRSVLRQVLAHAVREGLVERVAEPPADHRRRRAGEGVERMTFAEVEATIAALEGRWRVMGELIFLTGLRRGEAIGLTWRSVDLEAGVLRVDASFGRFGSDTPKTRSSQRVIRLSPRAAELLEALERDHERVFPYGPEQARRAIVSAMAQAGTYRERRGWHSLRHAHAALLDAAGVPLRDAAARMGHGAQVARTMSYGWSAEAGAADAIDRARLSHGSARASASA